MSTDFDFNLHPSAAETASGSGSVVDLQSWDEHYAVTLTVSDKAGTNPTLDVTIRGMDGTVGTIGPATKTGTGSAAAAITGAFTGVADTNYVAKIDGVGGGAEVGQATFKWSRDGGSTWVATGVTTSATPILLENGVSIAWTTGSGADFALNDQWAFTAFATHVGASIAATRMTDVGSQTILIPASGLPKCRKLQASWVIGGTDSPSFTFDLAGSVDNSR